MEVKVHWSMKSAIEQIEKCDFQCEGGPIANNEAWRWLTGAAKVGPEFWPGQGVFFEVCAEVAGLRLAKWGHFYIVGVHMDSSAEDRYWVYDLSSDPPQPYHYGKVHFTRIKADELRLEVPPTSPMQSER